LRPCTPPEYAAFAFTALGHAGELAKDELAYAGKVAEEAARHFIAPKTTVTPEEQLAFNRDFMRTLGLEVPSLTDKQQQEVFGTAAAHPDWRILAVPMLGTRGRHDLAERARLRLPNEFNPDQPVIRPPDDGTVIRELTETENLEGAVSREGSQYVIRYRTASGQLLPRSAYVGDLLARGEAVRGTDGMAWIFAAGDVRTYANDGFPVGLTASDASARMDRHERDAEFYAKTYQDELLASRPNASELYEAQWRQFPATETLIIMTLMHNAAREPNLTYDINLANETVHEMTRHSRVSENPHYLTTVRFRTQDRRIGHYARDRLSRRDYFYVRPFLNTLHDGTQDRRE
jgi:hypothetical protein